MRRVPGPSANLVYAGALLCCMTAVAATERGFDVVGQVVPAMQVSVSLHGATSPFTASTLSDSHGRFRFARGSAGQYTLAAFMPGYGEKRCTIDVGPSSAGLN